MPGEGEEEVVAAGRSAAAPAAVVVAGWTAADEDDAEVESDGFEVAWVDVASTTGAEPAADEVEEVLALLEADDAALVALPLAGAACAVVEVELGSDAAAEEALPLDEAAVVEVLLAADDDDNEDEPTTSSPYADGPSMRAADTKR